MTDPRLRQAQKRAAEMVAELEGGMGSTDTSCYLAGWAEAVRLLERQHEQHCFECEGPCICEENDDPCEARGAIGRFCDAMPGEEKSDVG